MKHYLLKSNCEICGYEGDPKNKLCRDHCHLTGMIRGTLCYKCNARIGIYESMAWKWRARQFRKAKHKKWLEEFEPRVMEYLRQDTGIPYSRYRSFVRRAQYA